jgi:hypothetical protein
MASREEYSIPAHAGEEVRERLYAKYRNMLDEASARRSSKRVIDVRASRTSVEGAREKTSAQASSAAESLQADASRDRLARDRELLEEVLITDDAYAYTKNSRQFEIELKTTPPQRGLFIDLEA